MGRQTVNSNPVRTVRNCTVIESYQNSSISDCDMRRELTSEMIVCLTVYGMSGCGCGPVAYDDLVDALNDVMPENEVFVHLDHLYDLGIIDRGPKLSDGIWKWSFSVSEEAEGFVRSAFDRSSLCNMYRFHQSK